MPHTVHIICGVPINAVLIVMMITVIAMNAHMMARHVLNLI